MYDADPNVYFGIPLWVFVFLLAVLATFAFWLKILPYVSALSEARPEFRKDHRGRRLWVAAAAMLGQRRRLDEPVLGLADLLILWAFLVHMVFFFWDLVRATWVEVIYAILPEMPLPFAAEFTAVRVALGLSAALGLTALVVATTARSVSRSARARSARIPVVTYGLLAVVFLSSVTGVVYRSWNDPVAEGAWWIQMLATAAFIAWLPFSRDKHVLFAPVSALTTSLQPSKVPPPSALAGDRVEFTWRELLGGLACADCRRCEQVCAAHARGESSPRDLMQSLKMSLEESDSGHMVLMTAVSPEQIWACDTCAACMQVCPSYNEHVPLIIEMRRRLVSKGIAPEPLQRVLSSLRAYGNSFGAPPEERGRWTSALDFAIADARRQPVEYLWFVGDPASWEPRVVAATQATARVLHNAGVSFGILYEAESNDGNDARCAGAEEMFQHLAERNYAAFDSARYEKIVTTDPHTFHFLKNEYEWRGKPPVVLHITELLELLIRSGRLSLVTERRGQVTYHDPCYLGRYNGVYEPPRHVLLSAGFGLAEMSRNRAMAACCGSGGGRVWMTSGNGADGTPEACVREAAGLMDVHTIAVACPGDLTAFDKSIKKTGLEERLRVKDVSELVEEALQATVVRPGPAAFVQHSG